MSGHSSAVPTNQLVKGIFIGVAISMVLFMGVWQLPRLVGGGITRVGEQEGTQPAMAEGASPQFDNLASTISGPRYAHNWDDNPVAYVPEADIISLPGRYEHNWDENPVAYVPEASVLSTPARYEHNWDENPVAYIPEASLIPSTQRYEHNWDENPFAYIPETPTVDLTVLEEGSR